MVAHAYNPCTWETEMGKLHKELKDSLGYRELDTNLDYKVRDPISRNKTTNNICRAGDIAQFVGVA